MWSELEYSGAFWVWLWASMFPGLQPSWSTEFGICLQTMWQHRELIHFVGISRGFADERCGDIVNLCILWIQCCTYNIVWDVWLCWVGLDDFRECLVSWMEPRWMSIQPSLDSEDFPSVFCIFQCSCVWMFGWILTTEKMTFGHLHGTAHYLELWRFATIGETIFGVNSGICEILRTMRFWNLESWIGSGTCNDMFGNEIFGVQNDIFDVIWNRVSLHVTIVNLKVCCGIYTAARDSW